MNAKQRRKGRRIPVMIALLKYRRDRAMQKAMTRAMQKLANEATPPGLDPPRFFISAGRRCGKIEATQAAIAAYRESNPDHVVFNVNRTPLHECTWCKKAAAAYAEGGICDDCIPF